MRQWAAFEQAVGRWKVGQLRIFLRTVAPGAYDLIPGRDRRKRKVLEVVVRHTIKHHKRSQRLAKLREAELRRLEKKMPSWQKKLYPAEKQLAMSKALASLHIEEGSF